MLLLLLFCESAGPLWILSLPSAQLWLLFRPELHGSPPGPSSVSITPMDKPSPPSLWPQTRTVQRVGGIYNPMISSQGRVLSMALHSTLFYPLRSEQPLKGPFKGLGMLGRKSKMQVGSRGPGCSLLPGCSVTDQKMSLEQLLLTLAPPECFPSEKKKDETSFPGAGRCLRIICKDNY